MNQFSQMRKTRPIWVAALLFLATGARAEDVGVDVDVTGDLVVVQACNFGQEHAELLYLVQEPFSGRTYRLRLPREDRSLQTGAKVRVRGRAKNSEVTLAANGAGIETIQAAPVAVAGEQTTIVMLVNFANAANECSVGSVSNIMFGSANSVAGLYQATSGGTVWFTGAVVGPFLINYSSNGACDYNGWANAADAAATAAGVNLSQYRRRVYVLPKMNPCSWAGLGTVGGNPARSWIGICDLADVYAHELGHNLGMHHSATDANNDGTADCEYCDNSDIMGYVGPGLRGLNAPHKQQLGWLEPPQVVFPTEDVTIHLAALDLDANSTAYPQAVKIAKPGTSDYYYFSYRRAVGYNSKLSSSYRDKTSVHTFSEGGGRTLLITTLADNSAFADPTSGLTVRQLAHNDEYATLQIAFGCSRRAPTAALTPVTGQVLGGGTATYMLTVTNNDSFNCGTATFQLTPAVVSGWSATVVPAALTIAGNQTGQATVTVTPPLATLAGNYPVLVGISGSFLAAHDGSVSAPCAVGVAEGAINPGLTAPQNLSARGNKRRIKLKWSAGGSGGRPAAYRIYRDGVLVGVVKKTGCLDKSVSGAGMYSYYVTAVDAAGNESPSSNVVAVNAVLVAKN